MTLPIFRAKPASGAPSGTKIIENLISTRLSMVRLNACGDGIFARLFSAGTVSDTDISSHYLTAFGGPHWQINAAGFTKSSRWVASKFLLRMVPSSIPSRRDLAARSAINQISISGSTRTAFKQPLSAQNFERGIPICQAPRAPLLSHKSMLL
jgi:hypothetical protein